MRQGAIIDDVPTFPFTVPGINFGVCLGDVIDIAANKTDDGTENTFETVMSALKKLHRAVRWWFPTKIPPPVDVTRGGHSTAPHCAPSHAPAPASGPRRRRAPVNAADSLPSRLPNRPALSPQWYFAVGEHDAQAFPFSRLVDLYEIELRNLIPRHARAAYYATSPLRGLRLVTLDFADAGLFGRDANDPANVRFPFNAAPHRASTRLPLAVTRMSSPLRRLVTFALPQHEAWEFFRSKNPNADDPAKRDDPSLLSSAGLARRFVASNGAVSRAQLAWLGHVLHEAEMDGERVIVFSHQPILPQSTSKECAEACLGWNYNDVLDVRARLCEESTWISACLIRARRRPCVPVVRSS